jgi:hypothetical protein
MKSRVFFPDIQIAPEGPDVNTKLDHDRIRGDLPVELLVEPKGEVRSSSQCVLLQVCKAGQNRKKQHWLDRGLEWKIGSYHETSQ